MWFKKKISYKVHMQYRAFKQMHELHVVLQIIISYILKTTLLTFVFSNRCVQIAYASSHIQTLTPLYQVSQTLGLSLQCLVFYAQIYSPWLWKFCHKSRIHKVSVDALMSSQQISCLEMLWPKCTLKGPCMQQKFSLSDEFLKWRCHMDNADWLNSFLTVSSCCWKMLTNGKTKFAITLFWSPKNLISSGLLQYIITRGVFRWVSGI